MSIDRPLHVSHGNVRRIPAVCLSLGLLMSPIAGAHEPKAPVPSAMHIDEAAKPAVAVVELFSAALQAGDLKRAGSLLADDVLILESGGAERSRKEYLDGHAMDDAAFLKGAHIDIKQRIGRSAGKMAWVGTESELHASSKGKPMSLRSTETMVLRHSADGWKIVHIHWSSRPVKAAAGSTP